MLAANASGLLLCWHFLIVSPEPMPNKVS